MLNRLHVGGPGGGEGMAARTCMGGEGGGSTSPKPAGGGGDGAGGWGRQHSAFLLGRSLQAQYAAWGMSGQGSSMQSQIPGYDKR